jgi:ferredoxin
VRVRVDPNVCQGHTLCAMVAGDIFLLGEEDGHAYVINEVVPAGREGAVRKAAATCPECAISIED